MFLENKKQRLLFYSITALGISSIITQIIIMREFLTVFYGNELVFGIILANWLLLTGIGSYLGKYADRIKKKIRFLIIAQIIIAIIPFLHVFLIRSLRNIVFLPGELISLPEIFVSTFILLLPYCLITGFLLTLACVVFSTKKDAEQIGKVYFIDNIGDILGGFLFSFILVYFLNSFQMVFFIFIINILAALFLSLFLKSRLSIVIILLLIIFSIVFFSFDLNKISTELQYKNQGLIYQKNSLYGNLVITKTQSQLNFFENGIALFTTENTIANEEAVHYAMIQHDKPKNVLLISGGVAGTTNEILKYNITRIDYVELDPLIIKLGRKYTTNLDNKKINIINKDARLFIKQARNRYDVVIIDLPEPGTAQLNRFYTIEFFNELKKILNKDAVVSLSLSPYENYLGKEAKRLNSAVYQTIKRVFKNVIIIPQSNFYIFSDKELSYNVAEKIKEKDIETKFVNEFYLKGRLTKDRINYISNAVKEKVPINKDFKPITYYYHLLFWMKHFDFNIVVFIIIFLILIVLYLIKTKPIPFAIFTTGFAASSLVVVLLIGFQILYGYVYHQIGIMITAFMLGLAIGAFYMNKKLKRSSLTSFVKIEFIIFVYAVFLPLILILLRNIKDNFYIFISSQIIFPILALIIAILVGMEFPLASKLHFKKVSTTAAVLYNADLIGACIGALFVGALLIPLIGIINVCFLAGFLNLISFFVVNRVRLVR